MGLEEKLPSGLLRTTIEKMGGYARMSSVWPAILGMARCATEPFQAGGTRPPGWPYMTAPLPLYQIVHPGLAAS